MKNRKQTSLILLTYILLMIGSSYTLYSTYRTHLSTEKKVERFLLEKKVNHPLIKVLEKHLLDERILFIASLFILILSMLMLNRKIYFIQPLEIEEQRLKALLNEIETYDEFKDRVELFKKRVENKNISELHLLMSEMLHDLHEMKKVADEANETKSLFLANMSHELRTPLNGIVGFTKFLKSTSLDVEQDEFVDIIRKSSEDLLGIINDILDLSKIENGSVELEEIYFNPMQEFESVIESYAANASKKDIDFSLWIDPSLSTLLLRSDPGKIKQVLINLISNAVKFTEKGGSIGILVENIASIDNEISIKFSVKDTGVGISDEQKERVFEAFTQADSSTNRKYGGTGLGLTISSKLVKALGGGSLNLESVLGKGSTFFFTLTFPIQKIMRDSNYRPIKVAIYAPLEVQKKESDAYLEAYLLSVNHLSLVRFKTIKECIDAPKESFDALYIHCDKIDKNELLKIISHHGKSKNIVLLTKLNKRVELEGISDKLTQILYEPITFLKVEKTFMVLDKIKESLSSQSIGSRLTSIEDRELMFKGLHALVVEDNAINQKMIQHTLKNLGITSYCANNGKEGLNSYKKESSRYDFILMDIQMPVMNGIDATKAILKYEKLENIEHTPIIAVTANALKGDREKFMAEGVDEYVSKPINLKKFITALEIFFPFTRTAEVEIKKDILLYKETVTEAKIISAILRKLDYSVDVLENIDELKGVMEMNYYKCILLDRVHNERVHVNVIKEIKSKNIPSLLFVDGEVLAHSSDKDNFTFISDKIADYASIKEKVNKMIVLAKAS